jgi:hypothetical protein
MKFVHGSMQRAFLPALLLFAVSCGGDGADYANSSARKDWRTVNDLSSARHSNPSDMVMQVRLKGLGYDPGPIDGLVGPQTRTALLRYQRDYGLLASGLPGPATRARLLPASVRLTGGYPLGGSKRRSPGMLQLEPRYPGDIAPFVGADDGYGLSPSNGAGENFYRILRSKSRETRQDSPSSR